MKIAFKIKLHSLKDGIIMYCSERPDGYEDFASVALKNGFLEFRFDTGSGKEKKDVYLVIYVEEYSK